MVLVTWILTLGMSLSGCSLLTLPFRILGSLIDSIVELVPKLTPLLPFLAIQVPEGESELGPWFPGLELPGSPQEAQVAFSQLVAVGPAETRRATLSEVLTRLIERGSNNGRNLIERNSPLAQVVLLRGNADVLRELERFKKREGHRWFLARVDLLPGEMGAQQRIQLVKQLREQGTKLVDLTPVPAGRLSAGLAAGL